MKNSTRQRFLAALAALAALLIAAAVPVQALPLCVKDAPAHALETPIIPAGLPLEFGGLCASVLFAAAAFTLQIDN